MKIFSAIGTGGGAPLAEPGTVVQELSELPADRNSVGYILVLLVEFDYRHPINVNLDGESCSLKERRVKVIVGTLQMVLPPACPLLLRNPWDQPAYFMNTLPAFYQAELWNKMRMQYDKES